MFLAYCGSWKWYPKLSSFSGEKNCRYSIPLDSYLQFLKTFTIISSFFFRWGLYLDHYSKFFVSLSDRDIPVSIHSFFMVTPRRGDYRPEVLRYLRGHSKFVDIRRSNPRIQRVSDSLLYVEDLQYILPGFDKFTRWSLTPHLSSLTVWIPCMRVVSVLTQFWRWLTHCYDYLLRFAHYWSIIFSQFVYICIWFGLRPACSSSSTLTLLKIMDKEWLSMHRSRRFRG